MISLNRKFNTPQDPFEEYGHETYLWYKVAPLLVL